MNIRAVCGLIRGLKMVWVGVGLERALWWDGKETIHHVGDGLLTWKMLWLRNVEENVRN